MDVTLFHDPARGASRDALAPVGHDGIGTIVVGVLVEAPVMP
jgi:hypothetical protein